VCWAWVPPLEDDDLRHDKHLHASVLRGAQHALCHVLRRVLRHGLRRVLYVPVLHVPPKGRRGGAARVWWAWVPPLEDDDGHQDEHLRASILRGRV